LPAGAIAEGGLTGDKRFHEGMFDQSLKGSESKNASAGTRFVTRIRLCCEQ